MNKLMELPTHLVDELKATELILINGGIAALFATNNGSGKCSGTNNSDGLCSGTNNSTGKCEAILKDF